MAASLAAHLRQAETEGRRHFAGPASEWVERRRRLRVDLLRGYLGHAREELRSRHEDGATEEKERIQNG